jgi:hypothetical protein
VEVVFPTALFPPAPPFAKINPDGALDELNQESPPATAFDVTVLLLEAHVPTLM